MHTVLSVMLVFGTLVVPDQITVTITIQSYSAIVLRLNLLSTHFDDLRTHYGRIMDAADSGNTYVCPDRQRPTFQ